MRCAIALHKPASNGQHRSPVSGPKAGPCPCAYEPKQGDRPRCVVLFFGHQFEDKEKTTAPVSNKIMTTSVWEPHCNSVESSLATYARMEVELPTRWTPALLSPRTLGSLLPTLHSVALLVFRARTGKHASVIFPLGINCVAGARNSVLRGAAPWTHEVHDAIPQKSSTPVQFRHSSFKPRPSSLEVNGPFGARRLEAVSQHPLTFLVPSGPDNVLILVPSPTETHCALPTLRHNPTRWTRGSPHVKIRSVRGTKRRGQL